VATSRRGRTLRISKPVVAAVNGIAFGGGFLLAQSADLVIAAETASFAISEAKVGRGAPWAAPLPWLVPPRIAMELLLTAEPITARRACEIGLVNDVVPLDSLHERVRRLTATPHRERAVVRTGRQAMVYAAAEHGRTEAFELAERIWEPVYRSADAQEGPRAFADKRTPRWQGR